jgi:hypothetical protein
MADQNKWFVQEYANPHSWLLTAENLHEQATVLYGTRDRSSIVTRVDANNRFIGQTRGVDKPVLLLCGFALENAIKAFLVYEHPEWVSNGQISTKLKSHSLTKLQERSSLIPYKRKYLWVLRAFESGLESWFRYPCGLTVAETKEGEALHDSYWDGYVRVMHAYGKRLTDLLDKYWSGPHGFGGRWEMRGGETLGYTNTKPLKKLYR